MTSKMIKKILNIKTLEDLITIQNLILCDEMPRYIIKKHYDHDHLYFIHAKEGQFLFLIINYIRNERENN